MNWESCISIYILLLWLSCFSRVRLCDPIDGSPAGSPVPGIFQARTLEWVCHFPLQCMKVKVKSLSHVRLLATPWTAADQAPPSVGFSRQEYGAGCHCLLHIYTTMCHRVARGAQPSAL